MQAFSNLTDFSADIILLNGISPSISRVNKVKRRTTAMIIFFFAADEGGGGGGGAGAGGNFVYGSLVLSATKDIPIQKANPSRPFL